MWDAERGAVLAAHESASPVAFAEELAADKQFRARPVSGETVIETHGGQPVAFFPVELRYVAHHVSNQRPVWAGAAGNHVYLFCLEGM